MAEELRSDLSALLQAREAYSIAKSIEHIIKDLEDAHSLTEHIVKESIITMSRQLTQFRASVASNEELRTLLESIVLPVRKIIQRHDEEHAEVDSHSVFHQQSLTKKLSSSLRLSLPTFSGLERLLESLQFDNQ